MGKLLHSGRRSRRVWGAAVVLCAIGLVAPAAGAGVEDWDWAPPKSEGSVHLPWAPPGSEAEGHLGPIPPQALELFADCPNQAENGITSTGFCIIFRVTDGTLKLGSTVAKIDPFDVAVAAYMKDGEPVIVNGDSGGGPSAVPLPGGILGVPELDPLLSADPLKLLSVSATPRMGDVSVVGDNPTTILNWAAGDKSSEDDTIVLNLPLAIGLDNLLLGEDCEIGPIDINVTNGPSGDQGGTGTTGEARKSFWWEFEPQTPFDDVGKLSAGFRLGSELIDHDFSVPGAAACGPLGLGKPLDDLGLNVVNSVVDSVAGLPAGSGGNSISLSVDTAVANYNDLGVGTGSWYQESLAPQG